MTASRRLTLLAALAALASVAPAAADDSNFRPYLMGTRAAGMGGAFTALADDGAGPWYNPGGIAFIERSQISASASVYGLAQASFDNALDVGGVRHDLKATSLNVFPTTTSGVYRLGDEARTDRADVVALGVFVPDALNVEARDQVLAQANAVFFSDQTQTVWVGASYAHRFGRVGLGATLFGLIGTHSTVLDLNVVGATSGDFAGVTVRTDETTYGAVAAAGLRWDVTDALHLGLAAYSPAVGSGSRRFFARGLVGGAGASNGTSDSAVVNREDLSATPAIPLRVQAGLAWTSGPLTLAADAMYLGARDVVDDPATVVRHVHRNAVANGSAGVEYVVGRVPLRAGLFTDFAASPPTSATSDLSNTAHVDRYGGSFSVGLKTEHTATDLGLNIAYGSGKEVVFGPNIDLANPRVTGFSQLLVYVFLASTFSF